MADRELKHIGFIVDGNRRWARNKNLPTLEGHKKGLEKVELVIEAIAENHVPYATFYLFSTENWDRSPEEVAYLMDLAETKIQNVAEAAKKHDLRCVFFSANNGKLSKTLLQKFKQIEKDTESCVSGTIVFCFNYGGQQEIADAAETLRQKNEPITIENLNSHIYHPEIPPCDLIVRTSYEQRISGFMLWRAAYSEFLFLEKYWPEMTKNDVTFAIEEFNKRSRRFGK